MRKNRSRHQAVKPRIFKRSRLARVVHEILSVPHTTRRSTAAIAAAGLLAMSMPSLAAYPPVINLSGLDGSNGFVLSGVGGFSEVSDAGDVNGDGIDDVVIAGSYVVFGRNTAADGEFPANLDLSSLDGSNGFTINGGSAASGAGDINGDGVDDIVLGGSYVVFGRNTAADGDFPANLDLSSLDGSNGFALNGTPFIGGVSDAGDINGDGVADLLIGNGTIDNYTGASYVVFGRNTAVGGNFPATVDLSALDGLDGFVLNGLNKYDYSGAVSGAGDINGDGIDDFIIGAFEAKPNGRTTGASYVVFGKDTTTDGDFPATFDLSALDGRNGFVLEGINIGDALGYSVSDAGDINGDGLADVIVGARNAGGGLGASYVVFGRNTAVDGDFPAAVDLSALDGSDGFVINGESLGRGVNAGWSVSDAGDINSDGIADVIIGGPQAEPNGEKSGASYVVFGRNTAVDGDFPAAVELSALDGSNGFVLYGVDANDGVGRSVSGAGDINDDGLADLIIGGGVYVVFGGILESFTQPFVRCPGDVNGDGITDIAVITSNGDTWIKGLDGGLVSQFNLTDINEVVDVETMPDINANSSPELVVLGKRSGRAEVWDTLTAEQLSLVNFDPSLTPLDLELIDDQTGNGFPELANMARSVKVDVKDGLNGAAVNSVSFSNYIQPRDLEIYPDQNGNGSPELAVLGEHNDPAKSDKIEVRDLATGDPVNHLWLGKDWQVLQQELIADRNGNGSPEVAVLRVNSSNDAVNVMFRDTETRQSLGSIGFDRNYPPMKLLTIPDVNGNGADEVVVYGQRFDGYNQKAVVKDSKSKQLIKAVFFDRNAPGQDIATCPDINGNGAEELVLLGKRNKDGKLKAMIRDAKTGELLGVVKF